MTGSGETSWPEDEIGPRVRRVRLERGLSQRELAHDVGISAAHLSRIEAGAREPSLRVIRALARELSLGVDYLEGGIEITAREELELALADAELKVRLSPEDRTLEREFGSIVTLAERDGELDIAARARAGLGLRLAAEGKLREAASELERAIAHPLLTPEVYPDVHTTLISVYQRLGCAEEAVALCERTLAEVHTDDVPLRTILATQLSHVLSDLGDFARAEQVLGELQADVELLDPYARARMHWSLARVAVMQDRRRLALRHMHRAIALLNGTEDIERLARAHLLCAEILLWGGRAAGVRKHLDMASKLMPKTADAAAHGSLLGLEALLAARQGRLLEGALLAQESLAVLADNETQRTPALYARMLIAASDGQIEAAEREGAETIRILSKSALWREASAVAHDWARSLTEAGEPAKAHEQAQVAKEFARRASRGMRVEA
jgi:transcriptional regulator with XRE-family HTH domain